MSGYDLSPVFTHSIGSTSASSSSSSSPSSSIAISPGSTFIACIADSQLGLIVVRESQGATVAASFRCVLPPDHKEQTLDDASAADVSLRSLSWSPDGLYLLASSPSHGVAWVFALASGGGEPQAMMVAGQEGMSAVEWGKGGSEVLVWAEHGVSRKRGVGGLSVWQPSMIGIHILSRKESTA